jgi:hypothetical protein
MARRAVIERTSAVEAYQNALIKADDSSAAAVAEHLAPDIVVLTNFGGADGREAAVALLKEPRIAGFLGQARWSEPAAQGDTIVLTARLPATMPIGGLEFTIEFDGTKIARVEQRMLPPATLDPVDVRLTDEIKQAINGALDNQTPMLLAYRDGSDQIHLSFRGTVQPYGDSQLALWARDPDAGLPRNIGPYPNVTLYYHDPATRTTYNFYGQARIESDATARTTIFDGSNVREQYMDYHRRGVAIVVDLDKVEGRGPTGRVLMVRSRSGQ